MNNKKNYGVRNLYILQPSVIVASKIERSSLTKREKEILVLKQDTSNITIGELNPEETSFQTIYNEQIIRGLTIDANKEQNYVDIFKGDVVSINNYLWNMEINDLNNKALGEFIMKVCTKYTHEELMILVALLKKEAKYYPHKMKKIKRYK